MFPIVSWPVPTSILDRRPFKISAQFEFLTTARESENQHALCGVLSRQKGRHFMVRDGIKILVTVAVSIGWGLALCGQAHAQTTHFTYRGKLTAGAKQHSARS
jgi:hypothetical protein